MKRGLITWDRAELPPSVFDVRLNVARRALAERDLPALVVYTDVWRSNQARFLTNFMPYWNRSLVVIPHDGAPVLLCALSPRVYPWIKSVTVFEDVRPAGKLIPTLLQLCSERGWTKLGVLDLARLPQEIQIPLELHDVLFGIVDDAELGMRRRAAKLARQILSEGLAGKVTDRELSGRLELAFRRAGAEDLILRIETGSVAVAMEYRGHWVKLARPRTSEAAMHDRFTAALVNQEGLIENLSGPCPYEVGAGEIFALHVRDGSGLLYGDTCWRGAPL
jgi:hypothetical protein